MLSAASPAGAALGSEARCWRETSGDRRPTGPGARAAGGPAAGQPGDQSSCRGPVHCGPLPRAPGLDASQRVWGLKEKSLFHPKYSFNKYFLNTTNLGGCWEHRAE